MLHRVVSRTNRWDIKWLISIVFGLLISACGDEEDRTSSDSELALQARLTGVNSSVSGTYRGSGRFLLSTDELGYEESRTDQVVISVAKDGRATIIIGAQSANLVFDNNRSQGAYRINESVSDYLCTGTLPFALNGDERQIKGEIEGMGECTKGDKVLGVRVTASINAIR